MNESGLQKLIREAQAERELIGEGLIWTVDIDEALSRIRGHMLTYPCRLEKTDDGKIESHFPSKFTAARGQGGNFPDSDTFNRLLRIMNNMGYFPSQIRYYSNLNQAENFDFVKLQANISNGLGEVDEIIFSPKYATPVPDHKIPDKIYHLTDGVYEEDIFKVGLSPRTKNKLETHPSRVYFCVTNDCVIELIKHGRFEKPSGAKEIVILEIDSKSLKKDVSFFVDPSHKGAYYTYQNIHPKYIKLNQKIPKKKYRKL